MGKRNVIISVILLITVLAIMGYLFRQDRKNIFTDPYKAVSKSACFVIETVDLQSFLNSLTTGKGLFAEAGKVREFDTFFRQLKYLTDQFNKKAFKELLNNGTAIISFHFDKAGELKSILSMALTGGTNIRQIKESLRFSGIKDFSESKLNGSNILKIPYAVNNKKDTVYVSLISGLVLCSGSEELIEDAMIQSGRDNDVRSLPGFSRVLQASGKNEDKLFVVFSNLPSLLKNILGTAGHDLAEKIARLAGTAGGDIYINEDGLVLSGYTESNDSSEYLYKYKSTQPRAFHTYKILPSSTVLFETLAMPVASQPGKSDSTVSRGTVDLGIKLREFAGEEITRAYINIKGRPVNDNTLIIYELANRVQAEQLFREKLGTDSETIYFEPDDQTKIPVYKNPFKGLTGVLLPGFAPGFDDSYFAFYDKFLITGNSFITISRLLYDNILNKTLANDLTYRDFEGSLPSRSGYFFYCVPARIIDYLAGSLNAGIIT
ncbi:MAG: hypothetical protein EPN88_06275, partial [Bacteroidetes bacterium]